MARVLVASLVFALAGAAAALRAQAPPGYYASVNTSNAALLRQTLHAVIDDHQRFPYTASGTDTWDILEAADEHPTDASRILDVYKNSAPLKVNGGTSTYDREHTWPKSYGFPDDTATNYPFTDCHQLFLCDGSYNSSRGNRPFVTLAASATERPTEINAGLGGGAGSYPGNSNWTEGSSPLGSWEIWPARRGDVARALFYLDVRYAGGTHGITGAAEPDLILTDNLDLVAASNTGSNIAVAYMGRLSTLLQWHQADPVDARERHRNDVVYSYQGNRNPFVDHPEWAACLFSSLCSDTTPPAVPTGLSATPGLQTIALDWADNGEADLAGYHVYRATASGGPFSRLTAAAITPSAYLDATMTPGVTHWYRATAIDTANNESLPGAAVAAAVTGFGAVRPPPTAWINELHYDNVGADTGEFVEVAGLAGTKLTGWRLLAYNGANGLVYATVNLAGVIPPQAGGCGALAFPLPGLQNGSPDGIALIDAGNSVVQFLGYEGTFTAVDGAAAGRVATLLITSENDSTPVGWSLQLRGTGRSAAAFTWQTALDDTPGAVNQNQTFR